MSAAYDEPEVGFAKGYLDAIADDRVPGWSYDIYADLLRFNHDGITRVWKRAGSKFNDGAEYVMFCWPD